MNKGTVVKFERPALTEQKQVTARAQLKSLERDELANFAKLRNDIAAGNPPPMPEGKAEVWHWHPRIPAFALRQYPNWKASTFVVQYRVKSTGKKRTETIGKVVNLTLKQAEKIAVDLLAEIDARKDPVADRKKAREFDYRTLGMLLDL
jgi:hypothetical protein